MKVKTRFISLKNKIIAAVFYATLVATLFASFNVSVKAAFPQFKNAVNYGRGVFSAQIQGNAVTYDENGNAELCYATQGGLFYVIDAETGVIKLKRDIPSTTKMFSMVTASDGKVYFANYPGVNLKCYDPVTKDITTCYGFNRNGLTISSEYADDDGKIYYGMYSEDGSRVYVYDIKTDTTTDYGIVKDANSDYAQGICADEKYIYVGIGVTSSDNPGAHAIVRIDKETGEKEFAGESLKVSAFREILLSDTCIISFVNSDVVFYDRETMGYKGLVTTSNKPSAPHPENPDLIYIVNGTTIREYNISTISGNATSKYNYSYNLNTESTSVGSEKISGLKWAKIDNEWVLEFHSEFMSELGCFNPKTKETVVYTISAQADEGPNVQSLEINDGVIYMGGYQTAVSAYDLKEDEFIFTIPDFKQSEGIGFLNGKTYFGTYPGAYIFRYNPEKQLNYTPAQSSYQGNMVNPSMVYNIDEAQDRPFIVKEYNGKLYIGTTPGYSRLGGALVIYEEDEEGTPDAVTYRNVIDKQSVTGIAVKDNLVYLSGSIRGGLGIDPSETSAKIAVFDTNTNTVVKDAFVPDLSEILGTTVVESIGDLSFGPDGLLWGACEKEGLVFAMDPDSFEIKKNVSVNPGKDIGAYVRPMYLRWGADGLLYTTAGMKLSVINPDTMKYKTILSSCSLMSLDEEGNIWYAKAGNFYKLEKIHTENYIDVWEDSDFQKITVSGTLVENGRCTVWIVAPDGKPVMIDEFGTEALSKFTKKYRINNMQSGKYTVYVSSSNFEEQYTFELDVTVPCDRFVAKSNVSLSAEAAGEVTASNFFDEDKIIYAFIGGYNSETQQMLCTNLMSKKVLKGTTESFEINLEKIESANNYKIFVWDESLSPVTDVKMAEEL